MFGATCSHTLMMALRQPIFNCTRRRCRRLQTEQTVVGGGDDDEGGGGNKIYWWNIRVIFQGNTTQARIYYWFRLTDGMFGLRSSANASECASFYRRRCIFSEDSKAWTLINLVEPDNAAAVEYIGGMCLCLASWHASERPLIRASMAKIW